MNALPFRVHRLWRVVCSPFSSLGTWVPSWNISEPLACCGEQSRHRVKMTCCNVRGIITETKWKQKNGNSCEAPSHSEYLNRFHCNRGAAKDCVFFFFFPKLSPGGERSGEEGESSLGPKLMASPLSLTLPGGVWGGGSIIFCSYCIFKMYFCSRQGSEDYD